MEYKKRSPAEKANLARQFSNLTRFLQIKMTSHFVTIFLPKDLYSDEPEVIFQLTQGKSTMPKKYALMLSALTGPELEAVSEAFNIAVELARPLVQLRDERAEERRDEPDVIENFNSRIYRSLPSVVISKRALSVYDPIVFERSRDALARLGVELDFPGTLREPGSGMAEYIPTPEGSEDAPSEDGELP